MEDIFEHKKEFDRIIKLYGLDDAQKAQEITDYILSKQGKLSLSEFSNHFAMTQEDAKTFISFIAKGVEFKQEVIDKNNQGD